MPDTQDLSGLSFENALNELEGIVRQLEGGKISLEDSVASYERGMKLRDICETRLKEARLKVQKVTGGEVGKAELTEVNSDTLT